MGEACTQSKASCSTAAQGPRSDIFFSSSSAAVHPPLDRKIPNYLPPRKITSFSN